MISMKDDLTKDGRHRFKWKTYDGEKIRIDRQIAPLLEKMWALGIRTTNCCQASCNFNCNHKIKAHPVDEDGCQFFETIETKDCYNNIWIAFESARELEKFYNIVAEYSEKDESMYHLMSCDRQLYTKGQKRSKYRSKDSWAFIFIFFNNGVKGHFGRPVENGKRLSYNVWIEDGCDHNDFVLSPQITFPQKHLAYVEQRLNLALAKKANK